MNDFHSPSTSQLLRDATDDLAVDADRIVRGGIARGRTIRRRRRVGTTVAAAAVVGVIGVAASVGPGLVGDGRSPQGPAGPASSATTATTAPTRTTNSDRARMIDPGQIPALVTTYAPGEVTAAAPGTGQVLTTGRLGASFRLDGLQVSAGADRTDGTPLERCRDMQLGDCRTQDDGSVILRHLYTSDEPDEEDLQIRAVTHFRPDGWTMSVSSHNSSISGQPPALAAEPPLDYETLEAIATSDLWFDGRGTLLRLLDRDQAADAPPPVEPSAFLAVAAEDVPSVFGEVLGGEVGAIRTDDGYPLIDEAERTVVHFMYDGTLTTFIIERADSLATCAELVDPANQPDGQPSGECVMVDGLETLTTGPDLADGVTSQGVMVWQHGFAVSALSYNAAEGKDVEPVVDVPPISTDDLLALASSDRWFEGLDALSGS